MSLAMALERRYAKAMKTLRRFFQRMLALGLLALALALALGAPAKAQGTEFPLSELTVVTADGKRHDFQVELALTHDQRAQGLMHRKTLAPNAGMLFIYETERPISMWMKNTYISLDMIFIGYGGEIRRVVEGTKPLSLDTISSNGPARGVLEVPAGTAARLGIRPGGRVLHPALGSAP